MFDLKALQAAKKQTEKRDENIDAKYENAFIEAIDSLRKFATAAHFDKETLRLAADKLILTLDVKKNKAEPYFYLAYIFYILENTDLSIKYFKVSNTIDPDLPGTEDLRNRISLLLAAQNDHSNTTQINNVAEIKNSGSQKADAVNTLMESNSGKQPLIKPVNKMSGPLKKFGWK